LQYSEYLPELPQFEKCEGALSQKSFDNLRIIKMNDSKIERSSLFTVIKSYRILVFWLIWGIVMSLVFGFRLDDNLHSFTIFMGFGIFLGLVLQFVHITWLKRTAVALCLVVAATLVWKPVVSFVQRISNQNISRTLLVDDVRQMASILETSHPDPYIMGGGKVIFHSRMHNVIRTIPEDGMTKLEFFHHLSPFLAAVGDGHTSFWLPFRLDPNSPGGVPLFFQAVDNRLYVAAVIDSAHQHLIGATLFSIEKVPFDELIKRQANIKGYDNDYQLLRYLGYDGSLWYDKLLAQLVPEWEGAKIHVGLKDPDGSDIELDLATNCQGRDNLIVPETIVNLPSTKKSNYVYRFMDEKKKTVLLLIENMYTYRETFEMEMTLQGSMRKGLATYLYEKFNDASPPAREKELIAGIPSATELFRQMLGEMKENQSENLIIDLRRNQGGNAFISTMFLYFLYGKEALISFSDKKSIFAKKYSPLFWKQYPAWNIRDINKHQPIRLTKNDYDFANYPESGAQLSRDDAVRIIEDEASLTSTFWQEYQSEDYAGFYQPKNIFILCSPLTNSSGYAFMYDHWAAGGKVVGIPSSQAGNSCGAWVGFTLRHSWLKGGVSHLYVTHFRDDPDMGRTFRPDHEMTYNDLSSFQFDPNAEILYTMDLIDDEK
jgi:hypothetical protein